MGITACRYAAVVVCFGVLLLCCSSCCGTHGNYQYYRIHLVRRTTVVAARQIMGCVVWVGCVACRGFWCVVPFGLCCCKWLLKNLSQSFSCPPEHQPLPLSRPPNIRSCHLSFVACVRCVAYAAWGGVLTPCVGLFFAE